MMDTTKLRQALVDYYHAEEAAREAERRRDTARRLLEAELPPAAAFWLHRDAYMEALENDPQVRVQVFLLLEQHVIEREQHDLGLAARRIHDRITELEQERSRVTEHLEGLQQLADGNCRQQARPWFEEFDLAARVTP